MQNVLLVGTFILAVLDWAAAERGWRLIHRIAKPATLLALIGWFSLAAGWEGAHLWFGLGLVFSLLGDASLLFERLFLPGLAAFLLAHGCYFVGFFQGGLPANAAWLVFFFIILVFDFRFFPRLVRSPAGSKMAVPISIYCVVLSLMLFSATLCLLRAQWSLEGGLLAALGAGLFFTSDNLLAFNRFVRPIPHAELWVMSTYHLGQIALVAGVVLQ